MPPGRIDPHSGRTTVALAGLLSAAAVIAYTANTARPRAEVTAPTTRADAGPGIAELAARAATARDMLDDEQMTRLVDELERFEASTTLATKATAAKVELLDLHAALALEASIRAEVDTAEREAAQNLAARSITRARTIATAIGTHAADHGRVDAALARLELASGTDITESFPVVLLPSFRDPELRAAAISAPLWRGDEASSALAEGIVAQLRATAPAGADPSRALRFTARSTLKMTTPKLSSQGDRHAFVSSVLLKSGGRLRVELPPGWRLDAVVMDTSSLVDLVFRAGLVESGPPGTGGETALSILSDTEQA